MTGAKLSNYDIQLVTSSPAHEADLYITVIIAAVGRAASARLVGFFGHSVLLLTNTSQLKNAKYSTFFCTQGNAA